MGHEMRDLFEMDDPAHSISPKLKGVRVCLMGSFQSKKSYILDRMKEQGCDEKTTLTKHTRLIVKGENIKEEDLLKEETLNHDGYFIPVINETHFIDILNGVIKDVSYPPVEKCVDITYKMLFSAKFPKIISPSKDGVTHVLGGKEIFIHEIEGNKDLAYQAIGNIGSVPVDVFDPKTTNYIMVKGATLYLLEDGLKDDFIKLIEDTYNKSDSTKFTYKFILESDLLEFIKKRSILIGDKISRNLIDRYFLSL